MEDKMMIGRGKVQDGLYVLEDTSSTFTVPINVVSCHKWHQRFGHPSFNKLQMLDSIPVSNKEFDSIPCLICPLAKQKKLSFPSLNNVKPNQFDLVHCDIWGQYCVNSH